MNASASRVLADRELARFAGRIAILLAAACPVLAVFLWGGPTAALWTAVATSAGLWAVADVLARRGSTASLRVLRARKIELVTADDRVVVALGETVEGRGEVALYDRAGACVDRIAAQPPASQGENSEQSSVLGVNSPFAFGFGVDSALSGTQPRGFAISRTRRSVLESAAQRRRRIAAERRSQVLGAIELSCSLRPANASRPAGTDTSATKPRKLS